MIHVTLHYIGMKVDFSFKDKTYIIKQFQQKKDIHFTQPDGKIVVHRTATAISMEIRR
jgi:hypothetical protein